MPISTSLSVIYVCMRENLFLWDRGGEICVCVCVCKRKRKKQRGRSGDIVLEATTQVIQNELEKEKKGSWR